MNYGYIVYGNLKPEWLPPTKPALLYNLRPLRRRNTRDRVSKTLSLEHADEPSIREMCAGNAESYEE